ncbi:hypothetical protein H6F96_13480 [Microcoleus sp. FACHB-53]|nr:hypothetical protein [Microcoleus sp. FACHB-53]
MTITVTLSPEAEAKLLENAARQGKDVATVAAELLASVLEWEAQDYEEAVEGIQRGLDDFEAGRFRSFAEFQRNNVNV